MQFPAEKNTGDSLLPELSEVTVMILGFQGGGWE